MSDPLTHPYLFHRQPFLDTDGSGIGRGTQDDSGGEGRGRGKKPVDIETLTVLETHSMAISRRFGSVRG